MKSKALNYKKLKKMCDPKIFNFNNTSEIEPSRDIIGQQRVVDAMNFGLNINLDGYNIYMSGASGEGKTSYALHMTTQIAKTRKTPDDWCYVYNFENPNQPRAISLPTGLGKEFKADMDEFSKSIEDDLSKVLSGEDYESERNRIIRGFKEQKDNLILQLNEDAISKGFKVKTSSTGIYFIPVIEGNALSEEDYKTLDEEVKMKINKKSEELQEDTFEIIKQIKELEYEAEDTVEEWESNLAEKVLEISLAEIKEKFKKYHQVVEYLEAVKNDIIKNLDDLREDEIPEEQQMLLPFMKKNEEKPTSRYVVNLLVDNSLTKGAPVIVDYNPTYYNLMGKLEYENEFGSVTTNYTMIKPGLFHQANGGYLILQVNDILNNPQAWEAIKRTIKTKKVTIENIKEQMGLVTVSALKPESIPVDIKVIIVGSSDVYHLLYNYDRDFKKLFKIKADFDDYMEWNKENIYRLAKFISAFCEKEGVPHFDKTGVAEVINYCSWYTEDQTKLTTRFNEIADILSEASTWAVLDKNSIVSEKYVKKAREEKLKRSNKYDEYLQEMLVNGTIMIDTEGMVVGQINGLSVIDLGDYTFGKPSRITAATYMGKHGIVNIEREINMSGESHTKGVMILSGYIGSKYAQEIPLSLTASVCFEQLYGGIDGDSASSTELYAILSSLAELPIRQGIAVTGSVNQKGEIQPIGGVTYKIEGFYELCKIRGLTGEQGVIIPHQNVKNLVLKEEIIEAVKNKKFFIYPIKNVNEGIELLTGVSAGEKTPEGKYPEGTVNYKVYEKLKKYAEIVSKYQ